MQIFENGVLIGVVAFVFGLFVGRMVWRDSGKSGATENLAVGAERAEAAESPKSGDATQLDRKFASIESEIRNAKDLLEAAAEPDDDLSAELEKVDEAVKRANGRLKLIMRSADRAKDTD